MFPQMLNPLWTVFLVDEHVIVKYNSCLYIEFAGMFKEGMFRFDSFVNEIQ